MGPGAHAELDEAAISASPRIRTGPLWGSEPQGSGDRKGTPARAQSSLGHLVDAFGRGACSVF
eukprot:9814604-Alexandrium_andersonii.AAC.1